MIGIYEIRNLINNKVYIGQAKNIKRRWIYHKSKLKLNKHWNKYLQYSYNKYGKENFAFTIIEECNIEDLSKKESHWCNLFDSFDRKKGYNLTIPKENGGYNLTTEGKEKISKAHKGKIISQELRNKISVANIGKVLSQETRDKMSKSKKGVKFSKVAKNNMSIAKKKQLQNKPLNSYDTWRKSKIKPVFGYNILNREFVEYESASIAAFNLSSKREYISRAAKGRINSSSKHIWAYSKEMLNKKILNIK